MRPRFILSLCLLCCSCANDPSSRGIALTGGMTISRSTAVQKWTYGYTGNADAPALKIAGDNIIVDFQGATLNGASEDQLPDSFTGTGVEVSGSNITIRNLNVRGYKIGLMGRESPNLRILGCDFSYNWKQHLKSTPDREDLSDWMSYHQNEKDEWLRYGAGIYLRKCPGFHVERTTIVGGQNGLMITECDDGKAFNNTFSFLSGVGIGMYRSSRNMVMHNRIDWCVRGYSHGVYNRGQDSAAILVYEQSSNNTFAFNSATHSGDGFFLWAGQTTMDSGKGGCNDNLIYGNDFSHAPTNGVEVTFSRNKIIRNRIDECDHGIWGGYSYETLILGNTFAGNNRAIAIEHGQDNTIAWNTFTGNPVAIDLWANARQDPNWGYPKHRDTRSRSYQIHDNIFAGHKIACRARNSMDVVLQRNQIPEDLAATDFQGCINCSIDSSQPLKMDRAALDKYRPDKVPGGRDAMLPEDHPRGKKYIIVDEWGPYDFRSPKLWPRSPLSPDRKMSFEVMGPPGKFSIVKSDGAAEIKTDGKVPGQLDLTLAAGSAIDLNLVLEYTGREVVTPFGKRVEAGQAYRFGYRKFQVPIDWNVGFYVYDDSAEPRTKPDAFYQLISGPPIKTDRTSRLDYASTGGFVSGIPADHFATVAEAEIDMPAGTYTIEITSDDGVRAYLDGRRIIDNWTWHVPTLDKADVQLSGRHKLRIEHFEIDGYAVLKCDINPRR